MVVNENSGLRVTTNSTSQATKSYAHYDMNAKLDQLTVARKLAASNSTTDAPKPINFGVKYPDGFDEYSRSSLKIEDNDQYGNILITRNSHGFGVKSSGISTTITNKFSHSVSIVYLDTIPWYLRLYVHTLSIKCHQIGDDSSVFSIEPKLYHYQPAIDRKRPHHLEMLLEIPARSVVEISFEFEQHFLMWTEFPPDANHGMYINPAIITVFLRSTENLPLHLDRFVGQLLPPLVDKLGAGTIDFSLTDRLEHLLHYVPMRLYTQPILISMPTPDFSMPYNVICLVCTVLSICFGPLYNLTTKPTIIIPKFGEYIEKLKAERALKRNKNNRTS